jgi:RNA polymerase sigma-70 factor (ECF subfamily)
VTLNPSSNGPTPQFSPADADAELLRKVRAGDRSAFGSLVLLYQDRLYTAVVRMVGDREEARELTQETFVRALTKMDGFRGDSGAYTWLFRIAMNLSISRLRKVKRQRTFTLSDSPAPRAAASGGGEDQAQGLLDRIADSGVPTPADRVEHRERDEQVLAALGRVDPEYRALLVLRDIDGLDYQQMADLLGVPLGTLKSRLFRARKALADELKPYFGASESR